MVSSAMLDSDLDFGRKLVTKDATTIGQLQATGGLVQKYPGQRSSLLSADD